MTPIEGYFLETIEGYIFEIKGIIHPSDRIIAYLRYAPSDDGKRKGLRLYNYKKIPDLDEREMFLQKTSPQYLWYDEVRGRVVQAVPNDCIEFIHDPIDSLRHLRDGGGHLNKSQELIVQLCEGLQDSSGISWDDIGVTGSQLVGLSNDKSDIDLVVYGKQPAEMLYSKMDYIFDRYKKLERYSGIMLKNHAIFRWGQDNESLSELIEIERRKKLQGLYNGVDFFIRLVKLPSDLKFDYGYFHYETVGIETVDCYITGSSEAIFTPCKYDVECRSIPELKEIVSYRGRYTEHVSEGTHVKVHGKIENVIPKRGEHYCRMILGESRDDYLLPISR